MVQRVCVTSFKNQIFMLTEEEAECFGWRDTPEDTLLVAAVRSPEGKRVIPTRQLTSAGTFVYGSVETLEPPGCVPTHVWQSEFGSWDALVPGLLM